MAVKSQKDLQRYFDGELSPRRARRVFKRMVQQPQHQQQLADWQTTGSLLREGIDAAAEEADFGLFWSKIQAGIGQPPALSLLEKVAIGWQRYRIAVVSAVTAAILAGVMVYQLVLPPHSENNTAVIESLDVGPEAVSTIYTINDPEDQENETTVIWVTETSTQGDLP